MLRLELLDEKLTAGKALSAHDGRTFSALSNQVRLIARELGVKAAPDAAPPSLDQYLARTPICSGTSCIRLKRGIGSPPLSPTTN